MRRDPAYRWHIVKAADDEPEYSIEAACWRHIRDVESNADVERALEIYQEQFERERFQPWLLANASDKAIWERLRIPEGVTKTYRHLFFDVTVFKDELDKRFWIAHYNGSIDGKTFLQHAVVQDVEAVAYAMGLPATVDATKVLESSMAEQYYKGMSLRYTRLGSSEGTVCANMLRGAATQALVVSANKTTAPTDELFKLVTRDTTVHRDDVEDEILHS